MKSLILQAFSTQIIRFLIVGFTGVGVDFLTYWSLCILSVNIHFAKLCGFVIGTILVFFMHRIFTFQVKRKEKGQFIKFFTLYTTNLGLNVSLNATFLWGFPDATVLAFLFSTCITTIVSFLGQKFWVFSSKKTNYR